MTVTKLSISLPKASKKHAEAKARQIARERGEPRPNVSSYIARLILRDRLEEKKAA